MNSIRYWLIMLGADVQIGLWLFFAPILLLLHELDRERRSHD